jgi:hypothetical protein
MGAADVDGLFRDVVGIVAVPGCGVRDVGAVRADAVHFLANFSGVQSAVAVDVVKVLALFAVFDCTGETDVAAVEAAADFGKKKTKAGKKSGDGGGDGGGAEGACEIRAMHRHVASGKMKKDVDEADGGAGAGFAGLVPRPSPEIAPATAEMIFRQLADLASAGRSNIPGRGDEGAARPASTVEIALAFIVGVAKGKDVRCVGLRSTNLHLKEDLEAVATDVAALPEELAAIPVVRSILVLTQFMTLYLYDPMMVQSDADAAVSPATYARVLSLLGPCLQAVKDEADAVLRPAKDVAGSGKTNKPKEEAKAKSGGKSGEEESDSEGDDLDADVRPPTAIEQMVYILVTVCRQHSATLRHIAASAFEVIASVADASVTAVIFDLLEADGAEMQEAAKLAKQEEEEEEEEGGPMDIDDESGSSSDDEGESDDEESDDEDAGGGDDGKEAGDRIKKAGGKAAAKDADSDEDSDEGDLTNIMLDDEDPAALEAYDKHLSNHMKLLKVEKKKSKRARQQSVRRASSAARLLDIVELLARRLRLRLEVSEPSSANVLYTFLDLFVRLAEFGYSIDGNGAPHLDRMVTIFCKHLDRPTSSFVGKSVTDAEGLELVSRWFRTLSAADHRRHTGGPEQRMLAHGSSIICGCVPQSKSVTKQISEAYSSLWDQYKSAGNRFIGMTVFTSAVARVPGLTIKLMQQAAATVLNAESSAGTRKLSLQALHSYIPAVRKQAETDGDDCVSATFWSTMYDILERGAKNMDGATDLWKHGAGVLQLLRVVEAGLQGGELTERSNTGNCVGQLLSQLKMPRMTETRVRNCARSIYGLSPRTEENAIMADKAASPVVTRKRGPGDAPVTKTMVKSASKQKKKRKVVT